MRCGSKDYELVLVLTPLCTIFVALCLFARGRASRRLKGHLSAEEVSFAAFAADVVTRHPWLTIAVVTHVIATMSALAVVDIGCLELRPLRVVLDLREYIKADNTATWQYSSFQAAADLTESQKYEGAESCSAGGGRRLTAKQGVVESLWLVYSARPLSGGNVISPKSLNDAKRIEEKILRVDKGDNDYTDHCYPALRLDIGLDRDCRADARSSAVPYYYGAEGSALDASVVTSWMAKTGKGADYFDVKFDWDRQASPVMRSELFFYVTDRAAFREWAVNEVLPRVLSFGSSDSTRVCWLNDEINEAEVRSALLHDMALAVCSFLFVLLAMWWHMRSGLLAVVACAQVFASVPAAHFVYARVARFPAVFILNFLGVFIIAGIGADDAFLFYDCFKAAYLAERGDERHARLACIVAEAYRRAGLSMAMTSISSAASFYSCLFSTLPCIRAFGTFVGTLILFNFVLDMTVFPATLVLYVRWRDRDDTRQVGDVFVAQAFEVDEDDHNATTESSESPPVVAFAVFAPAYELAGRATDAIRRRLHVEAFFGDTLPHCLEKSRRSILGASLLCVALALAGTALRIRADAEPPRFFRRSHNLGLAYELRDDYFASSDNMFTVSRPAAARACEADANGVHCGNGNGLCDDFGACVCLDGWTGAECQVAFASPTTSPTHEPTTEAPTASRRATAAPSLDSDDALQGPLPSKQPSKQPTHQPTPTPSSQTTTTSPSAQPSAAAQLSEQPTSARPSHVGTPQPTPTPTVTPTVTPTARPTARPTLGPTPRPTATPTLAPPPSLEPSTQPSSPPSLEPSTAHPSQTPCDRAVCSEHGECQRGAGSTLYCDCFANYFGATCAEHVPAELTETKMVVLDVVHGIRKRAGRVNAKYPYGKPRFSATFDLSQSATQLHVRNYCVAARDAEEGDILKVRALNTVCVLEHFELKWLAAKGLALPLEPAAFKREWILFYDSRPTIDGEGVENFIGIDCDAATGERDTLWVRDKFTLSMHRAAPARKRADLFVDWERYLKDVDSKRPDQVGVSVLASETYVMTSLELGIVRSSLVSTAASLGAAYGSLVLMSWSFLHTSLVFLVVAGECCVLVGVMVFALGWKIGIIEAISLSVFVGLSIDYSLHVDHAFRLEAQKASSGALTLRKALASVGASVCAAAWTTFGATVFLLFCEILPFARLGAMACLNTALAALAAVIVLPALLLTITLKQRVAPNARGDPVDDDSSSSSSGPRWLELGTLRAEESTPTSSPTSSQIAPSVVVAEFFADADHDANDHDAKTAAKLDAEDARLVANKLEPPTQCQQTHHDHDDDDDDDNDDDDDETKQSDLIDRRRAPAEPPRPVDDDRGPGHRHDAASGSAPSTQNHPPGKW